MRFSVKSLIGRVRESNQDCYHVPASAEEARLFIVADGMGGTKGGEIASTLAVSSVCVYVHENLNEKDCSLLLRSAVSEANRTVYNTSREQSGLERMGTTITAALLSDGMWYIAQVGDSRAYIYRNGELIKITKDHSYVQELVDAGEITTEQARTHPDKHKITRAVGVAPHVATDIYIVSPQENDLLLLCSDGLYNMLSDDEIKETLKDNNSAEQVAKAAELAGGTDNITVIIINNA